MPPEPESDLSSQGSAICQRHGLRFDPKLSTGCVRCRRIQDAPTSPFAGPAGPVGVALLLVGVVALAIPFRATLKGYLARVTAPSAPPLPAGAPPEHRRCLLAEGTSDALAAVTRDCTAACEAGWGASCRRLAGLCAPDASIPPVEACVPGVPALLQRACAQQDPVACAMITELNKAEILWKACESGLGPPCGELAPLCDRGRTTLIDGAPTTGWAYFGHPAARNACASGPGRLYERGCAHGDWSACEHPSAKATMTPEKLRDLLEHACDRADPGACRRLAAQLGDAEPGVAAALVAYARDLEACTGNDCPPVRRWRDRLSEEKPRAEQQSAASSEDACLKEKRVVSCWIAAEAYALGEGVRLDSKRADELNRKARALLKDGCAQPGGDCASADALGTLEACDQGDGAACLRAVNTQGGGTVGDAAPLFRRGIRHLRADCGRGKGAACWSLADLHGKGALPGGDEARVDQLRKGCDGRHGQSCNELAHRAIEGRGVPKEKLGAERLFRKSAELLPAECEAGETAACSALVEIFGEGKGVPRDETRATQYRAKATPTPATSASR